VETIGDAYMAVAGCPTAEDPSVAALRMANFAVDVIAAVRNYRPECIGDRTLEIRVGLHSGPVVAGVVGSKMPRCLLVLAVYICRYYVCDYCVYYCTCRYCLFGDTVNTASRMESNSAAMRIHMSSSTADLLRDCIECVDDSDFFADNVSTLAKTGSSGVERYMEPGLYLECRGDTPIKGKGIMRTYWLNTREEKEEEVAFSHTSSNDKLLTSRRASFDFALIEDIDDEHVV